MCKYKVNVLFGMSNGKEIAGDLSIDYKQSNLFTEDLKQDEKTQMEKIVAKLKIDFGIKMRNQEGIEFGNYLLQTRNICYIEIRDIAKV